MSDRDAAVALGRCQTTSDPADFSAAMTDTASGHAADFRWDNIAEVSCLEECKKPG